MRSGGSCASASAARIAATAPAPSGCELLMWWPSLLSPQQSSQAADASSSRCSSADDSHSPIDSPFRRASHGRQTSVLSSSSARKPYSVVMHNESQPPTTAASTTPSAINRAAAAYALAPDEHAVEITHAGPSRPSAACTKRAND